MTTNANNSAPTSVSGVQLAQGIGVQEAQGFWADAWGQVLKRTGAVMALCWLLLVLAMAIFAPVLANGHPLLLRAPGVNGAPEQVSSPLLLNLSPIDVHLLLVGFVGVPYMLLGGLSRLGKRAGRVVGAAVVGGIALIAISFVEDHVLGTSASDGIRSIRRESWFPFVASGLCAVVVVPAVLALFAVVPWKRKWQVGIAAIILATVSGGWGWSQPLQKFDYITREGAAELRATYTLIPFSAPQRFSELDRARPGTTLGKGLGLAPDAPGASHAFLFGSDALGQDVLTHLIHGCRLAVSIGLVSTGISLLIGVTLGAIAGYFGGWADILIQRLIEIFMAVPVLFLLIVAAGVLPPELRNVYVTMAIIGLVSWTGVARFTRAEFFRLRNQDFVQAAKAMGLPLRSILFKHMLPNGVTPVLVDASFAIAAAILAESTLSYLGLGPVDTASWGKLLSSAMNAEGEFKWWLAVFPGVAIFLTVLSYNILGEALRDAIDPKLKKARV